MMIEIVKQDFKENKRRYNKLVEKLKIKLPNEVQITHIGSTAIPNMYGKNILDILIGVKDISQFDEVCKILKDIGFIASAKNKDKDYQFFSSSSKETKEGDVHIHLSIIHTNRFKEFILIKEYLLKNKDEAQKYSNFKRKISRDKIERNEYKRIKSEYVSELLERAKKIKEYNKMTTTLYLIRHSKQLKDYGTILTNESHQGQNEKIILSVEGEAEANNLSKNKELEDISEVWSSTYVRAISTAKYIAERNLLKINIDSSLNERRLRKFRRIRGIRRKVKSSLYNRTNA